MTRRVINAQALAAALERRGMSSRRLAAALARRGYHRDLRTVQYWRARDTSVDAPLAEAVAAIVKRSVSRLAPLERRTRRAL